MAWGDVIKQLDPFQQFALFDISRIIHAFNIEGFFTSQWNKQHQHTPECVARHQPLDEGPDPDDCLICLVNSDDLDDEFNLQEPDVDYSTCICPNEIRSYKSKGAVWSLQ